MKHILKYVLWLFGGVVVLLLAIAVALPFVFDPNDYKQQIADMVQQHTGRQLHISGDLSLSVFPWLGVETGPLRLSNPSGFSEQPMLSVEAAHLRIKVVPLLRKEFQLDTIELQQPVVRLTIRADGRSNWGDFAAAGTVEKDDNAFAKAAGALAINGLVVQKGKIVWQDQQAGSHYIINDLRVETGRVLDKVPVDIKVRCNLSGEALPQTKFALRATALLDAGRASLQLLDPQVTVAVLGVGSAIQAEAVRIDQAEQKMFATNVSTQIAAAGYGFEMAIGRVEFAQASSVAQIDELKAKGRYKEIDLAAQLTQVAANLQRQTLAIPSFALRANDAKITGLLSAQQVFDRPRIQGRVQTNRFNLNELLKQLQLGWQAANQDSFAGTQLVSDFDVTTKKAVLKNLQATIDKTQASGFLAVEGFPQPKYQFDLRLGEIDIDRYLPAAVGSEATVNAPGALVLVFPLALLKDLHANGVVSVGSLQVSGLKIDNVLLGVRSRDQNVTMQPMTADLYGGKLDGSIELQGRGPGARVTVKQSFSNVQIGPLLAAARISDRVDGIGNLHLLAAAQERTEGQSVQGSARFNLQNGAIKGVDLRKIALQARRIYEHARGREVARPPAAAAEDQFQFTELLGSIQFNEHTASNSDLRIKSPLLRVLGGGSVDLLQQVLDYGLQVYVVESARGQGGEELAQLRGIPIPVRVKGPVKNPEYHLDVERLLKLLLQKRVQKEQDKLQKKLEDKIQNKLEKLLR